MQLEAVGGGQVPPELVFLAHHQGEETAKGVRPLPGREAEDLGVAARRINQAGEHFQGGRLAGSVRPKKGNHFARLDGKAHALDRMDLLVFAPEESAQGGQEPLLLLADAVGLREVMCLDDWHGNSMQQGRSAGSL